MFNNKKLYELYKIKYSYIIYFIFIGISLEFPDFHYIEFTSKPYRAGHFAFNSNKDMIIEYSYNESRLFYGISKNGRPYFHNYENEIYTNEIVINKKQYSYYFRYESRNIFISDVNNQKKEYLLSVTHYQALEIYELINGTYELYRLYDSEEQFDNIIYTFLFPLFKDNNNNYYIIYLSKKYGCSYSKHYCYINKFGYSGNSKTGNYEIIQVNYDHRTVSGFYMNEKIIAIYLNKDNGSHSCYKNYCYYSNIYDTDLNEKYNNIFISCGYFEINTAIFFKGIHLKNDLIAFIYYIQLASNNIFLEMKIGNLTDNFNLQLTKSFNLYRYIV